MTDVYLTPDEPFEEAARPLDHVTVENEDFPDECVIFPHDATETELRTRWIVASEGGFVGLESMR